MKKVITMFLLALTVLTLAACATTSGDARVKCPACGYEFDAPAQYK